MRQSNVILHRRFSVKLFQFDNLKQIWQHYDRTFQNCAAGCFHTFLRQYCAFRVSSPSFYLSLHVHEECREGGGVIVLHAWRLGDIRSWWVCWRIPSLGLERRSVVGIEWLGEVSVPGLERMEGWGCNFMVWKEGFVACAMAEEDGTRALLILGVWRWCTQSTVLRRRITPSILAGEHGKCRPVYWWKSVSNGYDWAGSGNILLSQSEACKAMKVIVFVHYEACNGRNIAGLLWAMPQQAQALWTIYISLCSLFGKDCYFDIKNVIISYTLLL